MSLSKAFTAMRHRYNINTHQMAKKSGWSIRNIQTKMADGYNPKFTTVIFLCEIIGCSISELIEEYNLITQRTKIKDNNHELGNKIK